MYHIIIIQTTHSHCHISVQVTITLVSMNDRDLIDKNIEAALCPLSLKEQTVMNEIMQQYLNPLRQKHWEGVELEQYQRELQQIKQPN